MVAQLVEKCPHFMDTWS